MRLRRLAVVPSEAFGGRLQDGAHAGVLKILEAKLQRIHPDGMGQFVHVNFAREMVRGSRQAAIGAFSLSG